ncbi:MAG: hypothetical protein IJA65_03945, partial [Acholeplasmatales bacterium]|nr:hypothetical protein [Acholeplasmatales bacterium]
KATVVINVTNNTFTYDGLAHTIAYTVTGMVNGDAAPSVNGNVSKTDAGTYAATLSITNDNYKAESVSTSLVINKAKVVAPTQFTATYGDTLGSITLPTSEYGTWSFVDETSTVVGNVGTHTFGIEFTSENNNYESYSTTVNVVVNKKTLTINIVKDTYIYDGLEHTIEYEIIGVVDGDNEPYVSGNITLTNYVEGGQSTTLVINTANYEASLAATLTIEQKQEDFPETMEVECDTTEAEVQETIQELSDNGTVTLTKKDTLQAQSLVRRNAVVNSYFGEVGENITYILKFVSNNSNYKSFETEITFIVTRIEAYTNADSRYEFVFDGSDVLSRLTNIVTNNTESSVEFSINGEEITSLVNAGTYSLTITYPESDHYTESSTTVTIFVDKATPITNFNQTYNMYWNDQLNEITLPSNYYFNNPETVLSTVGNGQKFDVTYDLEDENYYTVSGQVTVNVAKLDGTITVEDQTFTYEEENTGFVIESTTNHNESSLEYKYVLNGELVSSIVNAGTYTVTITLPATVHYNKAEEVITVIVNPKAYTPSVNPSGLTATYGAQLSSVALTNDSSNIAGTWSWNQTGTVGNAGTNIFQATFTPNNTNYAPSTHTLSVVVEKATVVINVTNNTFTYDGSAHTIAYTVTGMVNGDAAPSVTGNVSKTDAGTYAVTLSITNDNYKAESVSTSLVINSIEISNKPSKFITTYGDTLGSITLPTSEYGTWSWKDGNSTLVGNKGTHIYKAIFTSNNVNYNDCVVDIEVIVNPKKVTIVLEQSSYIYNGEVQTILYKVMDGETDITTSVTVIGNVTRTNVGTTNTTLALDEMNYIADDVNVTLTIAHGECPDVVSPSGLTATYGEQLSSVVLTNDEGNIEGTWSWNQTGTVGNAGTNIFQATFTPKNTNYLPITVSLSVKVEKKELTINVTNNTFTYDGSAHTIAYTVTGMVNGDAAPSVDGNVTQVNAGTYNTTLVIDSNNYSGTIDTQLVINKAKVVAPTQFTATYGDTLGSITLPTSEYGTWSFVDE